MSDGTIGQSSAEDDMDRLLRELTEGKAGEARFREASAVERAKAAARAARLAKKAARRSRRSKSRRTARTALSWAAAIAIFAGGGVFAWHYFAGKETGSVIGTAAPAEGALSPFKSHAGGPPADPFAGTQADRWADGAAGITVPAAASIGSYTVGQVAAAYATTRKLLIAQNLDRATLLGGSPAAFAHLLITQQRNYFTAGLGKTGLHKDGSAISTRIMVTSFAPGTTALIGNVIKVRGTMTSRESTAQGRAVLDIDVSYHFVYAVEPPYAPADWMRVVMQIGGHVEFAQWQDPGGLLQPWFALTSFQAGTFCGETDGFIHPDYPSSLPAKVQPSGAPVDPYAVHAKIPPTGCHLVTGT
jgi:hypothetical protein